MNQRETEKRPRCLVVCGPTASGKSELSDALGSLASSEGLLSTTILFDSMQVYREIPIITNQSRSRPARLTGIISVFDEWSVSKHKDAFEEILSSGETGGLVVAESGTGMYLNASLLGISIAPKVTAQARREAEARVDSNAHPSTFNRNRRREVRAEELRISGAPRRGSIWDGRLAMQTSIIYLRPDRKSLDNAIGARSEEMIEGGSEEARRLLKLSGGEFEDEIPKTVADSIGVRELVTLVTGGMTTSQAEEKIKTRTRQLSRRQMTWFDKLVKTTENDPNLHDMEIIDSMPTAGEPLDKNTMRNLDGIISWWTG